MTSSLFACGKQNIGYMNLFLNFVSYVLGRSFVEGLELTASAEEKLMRLECDEIRD